MVTSLTFLTHYDNEKNRFLKSLITNNETWILYDNPESKEQSKQWMHNAHPLPQQAQKF